MKSMVKWYRLQVVRSPRIQSMCKHKFFIISIINFDYRLSFMKKLLPKYFDSEWSFA